jgi:hypothetical protein
MVRDATYWDDIDKTPNSIELRKTYMSWRYDISPLGMNFHRGSFTHAGYNQSDLVDI